MNEETSNEWRTDSQLLLMLEEVLKQSKGRKVKTKMEAKSSSSEKPNESLIDSSSRRQHWRGNLTNCTISSNGTTNYSMTIEDIKQGYNKEAAMNLQTAAKSEVSDTTKYRSKVIEVDSKFSDNQINRKSASKKTRKPRNVKRTRKINLSDILKEKRGGDVRTSVDSRLTDNISDDMASLCLSNGSGGTETKPAVKSEEQAEIQKLCRQKSRRDANAVYPLRPSLFPNVPPYFNFVTAMERVKRLPKKIRETMYWKLSSTTPILVSRTVSRSGFRFTEGDVSWLSTWRHMTYEQYKLLKENQKVNHFPGTFHMGRKDRLWLNISKMQDIHGKESFCFMPQTFILPQQLKQLRIAWLEAGCKSRWIVKPPAAARGVGVSVVHRWNDVPKLESVIVQRYITRPYLINDSKFDLRLYVLVTSFDPLRLYIYEDGLVRFASIKYSRSVKTLGERFIHLTNYSVNRANSCYTSNDEENVYEGHKWGLRCLWSYFRENGIDDRMVWSSIVDIVIKTFISCDEPINRLVKIYSRNRYNCYELFGFDIMLDKSLKPWLLEVNINPSLHSNSQLDMNVKSQLIKDTFNTAGFQIPEEVHITSNKQIESLRRVGIQPQDGLSLNKYLYRFSLNREERMKQTRVNRGEISYSFILKKLNPDDVRQLLLSEDELARCGRFIRIFPSQTSSTYLQYFEKLRYYNLLLDAWEKKYCDGRKAGIQLLQSLCKQNLHLQISSTREDITSKTKPVISMENLFSLNAGDRFFSGDYYGLSIYPRKVDGNRLTPLPSFLVNRSKVALSSRASTPII